MPEASPHEQGGQLFQALSKSAQQFLMDFSICLKQGEILSFKEVRVLAKSSGIVAARRILHASLTSEGMHATMAAQFDVEFVQARFGPTRVYLDGSMPAAELRIVEAVQRFEGDRPPLLEAEAQFIGPYALPPFVEDSQQ